MAYSESMLTTEWIPQVRFPNGNNVNLMTVREAIQNEADENGIPVAFREDTLKSGGLFNKQVEDILVMYNPEHANDYLQFVIRVQHMGKYAFMHVYNMGGSKNYRNANTAASGGTMGTIAAIGGLLGGAKAKLQAEEQYYTILADVLANCVGA
ncbi:MAG: hypothetical protein J6A03_03205 [Lachnospiraceae bacterium]|nr:hypothetical protein [Lachnospiraceae bacterium]